MNNAYIIGYIDLINVMETMNWRSIIKRKAIKFIFDKRDMRHVRKD